jgi:hypothetical protein
MGDAVHLGARAILALARFTASCTRPSVALVLAGGPTRAPVPAPIPQ